MEESEWTQRLVAELTRLAAPVPTRHLPLLAHHLWSSSRGISPEPLAAAVVEAWPRSDRHVEHDLVARAKQLVDKSRELLRRLEYQRPSYQLRLLDAHAALCRAGWSTHVNPADGFEAIASGVRDASTPSRPDDRWPVPYVQ